MISTNETNSSCLRYSIIVPAYNSAAFIEKGIKSVLEQTYGDFELLLVDDGSEDSTLALCNEYADKDKRVHVFHQKNGGHTSARNLGLKNSRGKYVLFLDSDDWLDNDVLEVCSSEIDAYNPDVIVYSICQHKGETSEILRNHIENGFYSIKGKDKFVLENLLMSPDGTYAFPKSLSGKIFKREKILNYQLNIPEEVLIGEDGASFVGTVLNSDTVSVVSRVCYNAFVRNNSVSRTYDKLTIQRCMALLKYYQTILDTNDKQIFQQFERFVVAQVYTAVQFVTFSDCERSRLKKEFRNIMTYDFVKSAIKNAKFSKSGKKIKIKQYILRYGLLFLVKPLYKIKH